MKESTSSTEFVDWMEFLEEEYNRPSRSDLYLAQIAFHVVRMNACEADVKKIKFDDFIFKFDRRSKKKKSTPLERMNHSKLMWAVRLGAGRRK